MKRKLLKVEFRVYSVYLLTVTTIKTGHATNCTNKNSIPFSLEDITYGYCVRPTTRPRIDVIVHHTFECVSEIELTENSGLLSVALT